MFDFLKKRAIAPVREVLRTSQRGIYKRVDENRELMELLQEKAPGFLKDNFWVEGWLRSQDEFLNDLLRVVPIEDHRVTTGRFPRPWPENLAAPPAEALKEPVRAYTPPKAWIEHAYPLQQITVQLQGIRQTERQRVIEQLETVLARLRAGELTGEDHDDDFGYRFEINPASTDSFFDKPVSHR